MLHHSRERRSQYSDDFRSIEAKQVQFRNRKVCRQLSIFRTGNVIKRLDCSVDGIRTALIDSKINVPIFRVSLWPHQTIQYIFMVLRNLFPLACILELQLIAIVLLHHPVLLSKQEGFQWHVKVLRDQVQPAKICDPAAFLCFLQVGNVCLVHAKIFRHFFLGDFMKIFALLRDTSADCFVVNHGKLLLWKYCISG